MPRTVSVAITANTSGFTAGMSRVASTAKGTAASVKASLGAGLDGIAKSSSSFDQIGGSLVKLGAVGAVGLGLSAKAAVDWESAWTGVTKTVNGSAQQMGVLEGQLRGLAKTLPESHEQIAAVAEAAGQLGIQRDSIAEFTKTMVELGDTTNISSEDAATKLAQFGNIMGTLQGPANKVNDNISRLGATIVGLGNAGASTEADIVDMGLRIAGAGRSVGLTQQQVLGFSSAIASTGINVEAGGTAMSKVFLTLDQNVRKGGAGLDLLAATAGESAAQFKKSFQTDAAGATTKFIEGLGRVQAAGGDTTKVLTSLGIKGQYQTDVLRRLASAGSLLADNLKGANQAYQSNSALVDEASKRYATTGSQAKIALNQVKDSAITVGQALLPAFSEVATVVGSLASAFGRLSGPAKNAAVAIGLTVTGVGLVGGGVIKAVTGLAELRGALKAAGIAASVSSKAFKVAGLSVPVIGLALFAATTAIEHFAAKSTAAKEDASSFAQAMETVEGSVTRANAAINDNVRLSTIQSLTANGGFENAKKLGLGLATVTDASLGNKDAIAQVNDVLSKYVNLGPYASKADAERRNAAVNLSKQLGLTATAEIAGVAAEKDRREAMNGGAGAASAATDAAKKHSDAVQKEKESVQQEAQALQDSITAAQAAANAYLALSGSQIGLEAAIDDATAAAKKNGDTLNVNTEKGRSNQTALNGIAAATLAYTKNLIESGASAEDVVKANERGRSSFVKTAEAMGKSSKSARALADGLFAIPKDISSQVVVKGAKVSQKQADDLNAAIQKLPEEKRARIVTIAETKGAKAARQAMAEVKDKTVIAHSKGDLKGAKDVKSAMAALKDRLVAAKSRGDTSGAQKIQAAMKALHDKTVTARVNADTSGATEARRAIATVNGKTVTVTIHRNYTGRDNNKGATGGLVTAGGFVHRGPLRRSNGGPVWGAGSATSDSIDAKLSNGEFVIRAAAVRAIGISELTRMNAQGYAGGGSVRGYAAGGTVSGATTTEILRLIAALNNPIRDIAVLAAKVTAENRKVRGPQFRYEVALKAYDSAKNRQEDLRDRVNQLRKEADATKGTTKADRELKKARSELADANARVSKTSREKTTATSKYNAVAQKSKELTTALKEAQTALADSARQAAETLAGPYRSASLDVDDILESMKQGTIDLTAFQKQISKLRALGLSNTLVQQIVGQGAVRGGEIASQIIDGGKALAATLNTANKNLQTAADQLGYLTVKAPVRKALGGIVSGSGTGTSDSISARLSNGEYVVNAAATAANRGALDAINYGRPQVRNDYLPAFRTGGYVAQPQVSKTFQQGDVIFSGQVVDIDAALRRAKSVQRDSLTMVGLAGGF